MGGNAVLNIPVGITGSDPFSMTVWAYIEAPKSLNAVNSFTIALLDQISISLKHTTMTYTVSKLTVSATGEGEYLVPRGEWMFLTLVVGTKVNLYCENNPAIEIDLPTGYTGTNIQITVFQEAKLGLKELLVFKRELSLSELGALKHKKWRITPFPLEQKLDTVLTFTPFERQEAASSIRLTDAGRFVFFSTFVTYISHPSPVLCSHYYIYDGNTCIGILYYIILYLYIYIYI